MDKESVTEDASSGTQSSEWRPNELFVKQLLDLGISRSLAEKALFHTGNISADVAAGWLLERNDFSDDMIDTETNCDMYKMVFVVNAELQMGIGKVAAQVAHATLGIHKVLLQGEDKYGEMLLEWESSGETKIVLRGENTNHLVELEKQALAFGLPTYMVQDAGRTQVPAGSTTVLVIFGKIDVVDIVTGKLRLL
ncbi:hypothetical protein CHUAL_001560 [Chamberlinius hualienensis]